MLFFSAFLKQRSELITQTKTPRQLKNVPNNTQNRTPAPSTGGTPAVCRKPYVSLLFRLGHRVGCAADAGDLPECQDPLALQLYLFAINRFTGSSGISPPLQTIRKR